MNKKPIPTNFNSPCYECKDRHRACHDTCEKYIGYKAERKARAEEMERQNEIERYTAKLNVRNYDDYWRRHIKCIK